MNKDQRATLVEYVGNLSDGDLYFLTGRLTDRLQGDLDEALEFMSKVRSIDALLYATESATELYALADQIRDLGQKECKRRGPSNRN